MFELFHTDLEIVLFIHKPGFYWPWIYLQCYNPDLFLWSFCQISSFFQSMLVSNDVYISNPLNDWLGVSCISQKLIGPECFLVQWYVLCTTKAVSARIPIHVSASSKYVSWRLYVRTWFPITWFILSMVVFVCVLPEGAGFFLIPYSCYNKKLLNSWPSLAMVMDQPHSFYKVRNRHCFLVVIFYFLKPPSYGVYHCNGS